jgi:Potassium-transporting ATPase A subunit
MTVIGWLEIAVFAAIVGLLTRPLGGYLARVYAGHRTLLQPLIGPIEAALYRFAGIKPDIEQSWLGYTVSLLVFHSVGIITLHALLRMQSVLPLNPQRLTGVPPDLAMNTAISFVTNTAGSPTAGRRPLATQARWPASPFNHFFRPLPEWPLLSPLCADLHDVGRRPSVISGSISRGARSTCCCRSVSWPRCSL